MYHSQAFSQINICNSNSVLAHACLGTQTLLRIFAIKVKKNEVVTEKVLERKANVRNYSAFMSMKIMHQRRGNIHGVRLKGDKFWSTIFEQTSGDGELA